MRVLVEEKITDLEGLAGAELVGCTLTGISAEGATLDGMRLSGLVVSLPEGAAFLQRLGLEVRAADDPLAPDAVLDRTV